MRHKHLAIYLASFLVPWMTLGYAAPARAATWTVCSSGCDFVTITDAIAGAAAGDTLELGAETFTENIVIDKDLLVQGEGTASTTAFAPAESVVTVNAGVTAVLRRVTLVGVIANEGSAIRNGGNLTVRDTVITGGLAILNGGSIWVGRFDPGDPSPELTLDRVTIDGGGTDLAPAPDGAGGAVYIGVTATATITDSTISNATARSGGGIHNQGTLTIIRSTITGNLATEADLLSGGAGGGIMNQVGATVDIRNSTISGNTSNDDGGGLFNISTAALSNTTVSGNTAVGSGGGIYVSDFASLPSVILNNTTVTDNDAPFGGGIFALSSVFNLGNVTMRNSIIASQAILAGSDCDGAGFAGNPFTSADYNIDSDGSCNLIAGGDQSGVISPGLLPLGDYGGPTETHNLDDTSAAIDGGDPAGCQADVDGDGVLDGSINSDQRGQIRVDVPAIAGGCDAGAVEYNLVSNGMMEDDDDGDRAPDGWLGTNLKRHDRRVCKRKVANNGRCATLLRGRNNATKEFFQSISRPGGIANDQYELVVNYATRNANPANSLEAVVRFEDSAAPANFNEVVYALTAGTHGYQRFVAPAAAAAANNYDTIKVIAVRSSMNPNGRILIDDVSLVPF